MTDLVIDCDVLVIGGGIAGCFAALKAKEAKPGVVVANKGKLGRSGYSHQMSGVLTYFEPDEDNQEKWYKECLEIGGRLVDRKRLEGMVEETTWRIKDLERWGVTFQKAHGKLIRKPGVGQIYARNVVMTDGGFQLMSALRETILRSQVNLLENVMVTDLLSSDGEYPTQERIVGAVGFDVNNGRFYVLKAKAVVIAAGCCEFNRVAPHLSGDGKAMALRAGGQMRNIELTMPTPKPAEFDTAPGANILFGSGAYLVNARGERFMKKWDPVRMERASRVVVSQAIAREEMEGRGPVYLDARHLDKAALALIEQAMPIVVKAFRKAGLDLAKDKIKYTSTVYYSLGAGGIKVDKDGATTLPGLWTAGDSTDRGEDGISNVITHGMESAIEGHRAGEAAANYALGAKKPALVERQVERLKEFVFAPLNRQPGIDYQELARDFKEIAVLVGMTRSEGGLKEAIEKVANLQWEKVPKLAAGDHHKLSRVLGVGNQLLYLDLLARCALYRTESRGGHFRRDYPEQDDGRWLKWTIAKKEKEEIKIWDEPVTS